MIILTTLKLITLLVNFRFVLISFSLSDIYWKDKICSPLAYRLTVFSVLLMNIFIILHDSGLTLVFI